MQTKLFVATKAFIKNKKGQVLIVRESSKYSDGSNIGRFDIVGGRLKPGERFDQSLLREIKEETGLSVKIGKPFFVNEWRPVVKGEQWQIVATFFECTTNSSKVILGDDHDHFEWIDPKDYKAHNLISNLRPAFKSYLNK